MCRALIRAALQGSAGFLFSSLSPDELETVVMAMSEKAVVPGDVVIKQGDKGDYFYVVESGTFSIFVNGTKVAARSKGDAFGELALLYNCPRAATIQADSPGRLWALDRVTFRYMVASTREGQLAEIVVGLRCVHLGHCAVLCRVPRGAVFLVLSASRRYILVCTHCPSRRTPVSVGSNHAHTLFPAETWTCSRH